MIPLDPYSASASGLSPASMSYTHAKDKHKSISGHVGQEDKMDAEASLPSSSYTPRRCWRANPLPSHIGYSQSSPSTLSHMPPAQDVISSSTRRRRPRAQSIKIPSSLESSEKPKERLSASTKDILFGSIAGMTAKLFEHPFDLVKVRLQTQGVDPASAAETSVQGLALESATQSSAASSSSGGGMRYRGAFHCFASTYTNEGIRGLYRGLSMPIMGAVAENATLFFTYNFVLRTLHSSSAAGAASSGAEAAGAEASGSSPAIADSMSIGQLTLAAATAGAATSFVLTPIELVKCRMQVQMIAHEARQQAAASGSSKAASPSAASSAQSLRGKLPKLEGPLEIISSTLRSEGVRGLWLGQTGTLLRETGGGIAWFLSFELATRAMMDSMALSRAKSTSVGATGADALEYERRCQRKMISRKDLASGQLMAAGALSGVMYNVVLFPADSVKSTIQTEKEMSGNRGSAPTGFLQTFKKIYRTKGIKGLYAGCGITCLRSGPSSALIFLLYNRLAELADEYGI